MQIKKFLTKLWDKIKYDESGQVYIPTRHPVAAYRQYLQRIVQKRATVPEKEQKEIIKKKVWKTPPPEEETPWRKIYKGKTPAGEYFFPQSTTVTPKETVVTERPSAITPAKTVSQSQVGTPAGIYHPPVTLPATSSASPEERARAMAYLKEYVGQMKAAGFNDIAIREKLKKIGSVNIPTNLPANFGQTGAWATGMADEFKQTALEALKSGGTLDKEQFEFMPSPDEYLNYMPGGTASRLPTGIEKYAPQLSPYYSPSGKFSQAKFDNLSKALANYMTTYKGETAPFSQWTAEADIGELPKNLAQQYYQEFQALAEQKAEEAKAQEEYKEELKGQQEVYKGEMDVALKEAQSLVDEWMKTTSEGGTFLAPIQDTDDKGNPINRDPLELIIGYIRSGESIENIAAFINSNQIPITNYQLQGLYYLYGQ